MWLCPNDTAHDVSDGGFTLVAIFGVVAVEGSVAVRGLVALRQAVIVFWSSLPASVTTRLHLRHLLA